MRDQAGNLRIKLITDFTDGDVEEKVNKFFRENPELIILDIKYFNGYSVVGSEDLDSYGRETAMIVYCI